MDKAICANGGLRQGILRRVKALENYRKTLVADVSSNVGSKSRGQLTGLHAYETFLLYSVDPAVGCRPLI